MTTPFAGRFGAEAILSGAGQPIPNTPVTVYISGTTTVANLYSDETRATAAPNPVSTDSYGNLTFYAAPGLYDLAFTVGGLATTVTVEVSPWYAASFSTIGLFGSTGTSVGTLPGATVGGWLVQAGYDLVAPSSGLYTFAFPTPFPNGIVTVLLTNSNGTTYAGTFAITNLTLSDCTFALEPAGTGQTVQVNWLAIGA